MLRLFSVLLLPLTLSAQLKRFEFTQHKMGSPFRIVFYHTDSARAATLAIECFLIVDTLNNIFSDYTSESETGKLSQQPAHKAIKVSDEMFSMILRCRKAWSMSGGTFDISIGALTHLWRKAKAEKKFPTERQIKDAKRSAGFQHVVLGDKAKTVLFRQNGMSLDFGGIAKGYAAQRIIDHLQKNKITAALADAGGDIVLTNPPPGRNGWNIAINLPEQTDELMKQQLGLKNCAVATSGDVYNYFLHDGKKYSHIIDPGTGYGVTTQRNVTVIASDGATADWLATACSILPVNQALALAKKENAALMIATIKKGRIVRFKTKNFDNYFQKKQP